MVVERVRVIGRIHSDHCTPFRIPGEIPVLFAGRISVPVFQCVTETFFGQPIGLLVPRLEGKRHIMHHLGQPFAAPVCVRTEGSPLRIVGIERFHPLLRKTIRPLHRRGEERQHSVHTIGEIKIIPSLRQMHTAARGHIRTAAALHAVFITVIMVGQETHKHVCLALLRPYAERRSERRGPGVVFIVHTCLPRNTEGVRSNRLFAQSVCKKCYRCNVRAAVNSEHGRFGIRYIGGYPVGLYPYQWRAVHAGYAHPGIAVLHNERHHKVGPCVHQCFFERRLASRLYVCECYSKWFIPLDLAAGGFPIGRITDLQSGFFRFRPSGVEPEFACPAVDQRISPPVVGRQGKRSFLCSVGGSQTGKKRIRQIEPPVFYLIRLTASMQRRTAFAQRYIRCI